MFVYLITNSVTGKIYVGQHKGNNLKKYLQQKISHANAKNKPSGSSHLFASMRKHPKEAWEIAPLVSDVTTREALNAWEQTLIELFNTQTPEVGYNVCRGGEGFTGPHSLETKLKMSESHMRYYLDNPRSANPWVTKVCPECGNPFSRPFSERDSILCSISCLTSKFRSEEVQNKRKENQRTAMQLPEVRANLSKGQLLRRAQERELGIKPIVPNYVWTEEHRQKMSDRMRLVNTGRVMPDSQRAAISKALHGLVCDNKRKDTLDKGRHTRWHSSKGIVKDGCKFCLSG
jgi:hypothetical protein